MRIAITGNIGCGKSTFTKLLVKHLTPNYTQASIDEMVHELYKNTEFAKELKEQFRTDDRKQISDIVFNDPEQRKWLEDLVKTHMRLRMIKIDSQNHIVVEFPLLFEMCNNDKYDFIITCMCDDETQEKRVTARDGFTAEKIAKIRGAQLSTIVKSAMSDETIDTNVSLEELETEAKRIAGNIARKDLRLFFQSAFYKKEKEAGELFDNAMKQYHGFDRHWHNADHPLAMYRWFMSNLDKFNYPGIAGIAIIYHDVVYSTYKTLYPHNESQSVKFMIDQFKAIMPEALRFEIEDGIPSLAVAAEYIMSTKTHSASSHFLKANPKLKNDCELFLDVDLMMLGGTPEEAEAFDDAVYQEFKNEYEIRTFARGRVSVLKTFLRRPKVFQSSHFAHLEDNARANLDTLIKKWERWV
jgi:dephospho-CoA kinase